MTPGSDSSIPIQALNTPRPDPRGEKAATYDLRMQEVSFGDLSHAALTLRAKPSLEPLWASTCRVLTEAGEALGSGFLVNGGPDGIVVVTNAHVVHPRTTFEIERVRDGERLRFSGYLIAIDYPHDLAILRPISGVHALHALSVLKRLGGRQMVFPGLKLAPGTSPLPGEEVWVCGYPFGVDTPRISRGLVSGHGVYKNGVTADREMQAVVLDAQINPGNSGGPVCDKKLRVVGVCVATQPPIPDLGGLDQKQGEAVSWILKRLRVTGTGIGYAIDPVDLKRMLLARASVPPKAQFPTERYRPTTFPMRHADFVSLQSASLTTPKRPHGSSPIGPFSFDQSGKLFLGWPGDRIGLPSNTAWVNLLLEISRDGGSFLLRGYDVVLYRKKYGGYIVPATIQLQDW